MASSDLEIPVSRSTNPPQPGDSGMRRDDYRLVQRLAAGDGQAWAEFVVRFQRLVLTRIVVAAREIGQSLPQPDAEDLCAEVFSRLVANQFAVLRRFEGRSTLSTWLCVVTRRIAIRRLSAARREPSRPAGGEIPSVELLPAREEDDPLVQLIGDENHDLLAAGLAGLGERQRQLACLFYLDGRSYREISEQLDIPLNSIGPTLNRIQQKLRAAMKEQP